MTQEEVTQGVPEAEPIPEPEGDKPPTIEELQAELARLKENSEKLESNWKSAQRDSSKKELTIQQMREQLSSNESQSDMIKALIAMMAQQGNKPTEEFAEEVKAQQPDLLKQYEQIVAKADKKRQLDRAKNRIRAIQERTEALGVQGEDYDVIRVFAEAGQYDKAERKLAKLEEAKQTKPPEKKETEEEKIERLAAEKVKAELEKRGLLTQDTGTPSASAMNRKQKIKAYAEGKISREEYEKAIS